MASAVNSLSQRSRSRTCSTTESVNPDSSSTVLTLEILWTASPNPVRYRIESPWPDWYSSRSSGVNAENQRSGTCHGDVRMYDRVSRTLLGTLLPPDPPQGEGLSIPMALASHGERVYVSDMGGGRVQVFSRDGQYLQSIGSFGMGFGQFQRVKGIAVDGDQILYAVDAAFRNVQMFDGEGRLLMFFGGGDHGLTSPARVVLDYDHMAEFEHLVDPQYELSYLILVTDLVGPDKLLVYGFVRPRQGTPGRP